MNFENQKPKKDYYYIGIMYPRVRQTPQPKQMCSLTETFGGNTLKKIGQKNKTNGII